MVTGLAALHTGSSSCGLYAVDKASGRLLCTSSPSSFRRVFASVDKGDMLLSLDTRNAGQCLVVIRRVGFFLEIRQYKE